MAVIRFTTLLLTSAFVAVSLAATVRPIFEKCETKGYSCANSNETSGKIDVAFKCVTNITGQDVTFYLWNFNSPAAITSFTIEDCDTVRLSFACSAENKPIQWLKIRNVRFLEIMDPALSIPHNPPQVTFENIQIIDAIPRHTFAQIKKILFKPGCFVPITDLQGVTLKYVNIGKIDTEAFWNLSDMKNFTWEGVVVGKAAINAVDVKFINRAGASIRHSTFEEIEPMAFRIAAESFSLTRSRINNLWGNGINGTLYNFEFSNNSVGNIQSGAISVLAQHVQLFDNRFENIESGAFLKIAPGLLHDSMRNFGRLLFSYHFNQNHVQAVQDGGIRPDIVAYKNVAADVTYLYNTLQCSCEAMSWLGADQELGFGKSVLRDFNMMLLDSENSNTCNFSPCMCFGVRDPKVSQSNGNHSLTATVV